MPTLHQETLRNWGAKRLYKVYTPVESDNKYTYLRINFRIILSASITIQPRGEKSDPTYPNGLNLKNQ